MPDLRPIEPVSARHHLAVISGPDVGWVAPLGRAATVVGRSPEASLPLADRLLSREHFEVRERRGQIQARDLRSANGTRTSGPARQRRSARRLRTRWRTVPVGTRLHAGATIAEIRVHPAIREREHAHEPTSLSEGIVLRLMFPVLMCGSSLPMLLNSGTPSPWRIVIVIAMPIVLVLAVVWPALRERIRRRGAPKPADADRQEVRDRPLALDPAGALFAADHPWQAGETGHPLAALTPPSPPGWDVSWEIGLGDRRCPPIKPDGGPRRRDQRRLDALREFPPPAPGSGLALVGEAEAVRALARWLVCQLAVRLSPTQVLIDPPAQWSWAATLPHHATHPSAPREALRLRVFDHAAGSAGPIDSPEAPTRAEVDLFLAADVRSVPAWCMRIIEVSESHNRRVSVRWAHNVADRLAAARTSAAGLPPSVHLTELVGTPAGGDLLALWRDAVGLSATLGVDERGVPLRLNLAEAGPHALVAGTTGSGKSELLLAWILGLAHGHSPADASFVLVDYKGGATFAAIADLPHVVGVLTDLDAAATSRALDSLKAELHRRERVLAACGAANLADQRRRAAPRDRLGRLVVVVDEFRAMADEHPDFLDALVRLAAQGRSLGIHLVLATQRPGGAITADMRANLTVRICLRVLEDVDSLDLLGEATAARLPAIAGRAILRTEGATAFQAAWCGPSEGSEVAEIVARIQTAAELLHESLPWRDMAVRPWAPPLPESLDVADLTDEGTPPARQTGLPLVRTDLPAEQRLGTWALTPAESLLVSGPPGSGRTTALRTLAHGALRQGVLTHVLAEDHSAIVGEAARLGSGPLALGTVCPPSDARRARRLLDLLLSSGSRAPSLLLIDDVDALFAGLDAGGGPGEGVDVLTTFLRQARRNSISVALTAPPAATRWAALTDHHLVLRPRDIADAIMAGVPRTLAGTGWPAGRGVLLTRGDAVLAHVAQTGQVWPPDHVPGLPKPTLPTPPYPPLRLKPLPELVELDLEATNHEATGSGIPLGIGSDDARVISADLPVAGTWLVTGPAGSGRTNTLTDIARRLEHAGVDVWRDPQEVPPHTKGTLVLDDADRLPAATASAAALALASGPVALVGAARPDTLLSTYHEVAARLRDASTMLVLGSSPGANHLTSMDIRRCVDPGTRLPGRAVLIDGRRVEPLQLARAAPARP